MRHTPFAPGPTQPDCRSFFPLLTDMGLTVVVPSGTSVFPVVRY